MPTSDIVQIGFLVITMSAFLQLVFVGDSRERVFQKIIGGFGVFVVALLSNNAYVIWTSLFIGGLIIASEHFMKILVAILRADSSDIKELVRIEPATKEEVEQKLQVEQAEVQEALSQSADPTQEARKLPQTSIPQNRISYEERSLVEKKVTEDLINRFGVFYESGAKVYFKNRALIFDGIIRHQISAKNLSSSSDSEATAVEIKYLPSIRPFMIEMVLSRAIGRILGTFEKMNLLLVVVAKDIKSDEAWETYNKISERYPRVFIAIYNYDSETSTLTNHVMKFDPRTC